MGEVFNALEVLNRTMKLGLSSTQLMRAEAGFKSALAMKGNPDPTREIDLVSIVENYEVKATLTKREKPLSLGTLEALAKREMTRPALKADAKALRQFDRAVAGATPVSAKEAAKAVGGT